MILTVIEVLSALPPVIGPERKEHDRPSFQHITLRRLASDHLLLDGSSCSCMRSTISNQPLKLSVHVEHALIGDVQRTPQEP